MTRLMVSVRDAAEARAALVGGAELIDVKEPLRGPLGRADSQAIADVVQCVSGRVPVSAALGELLEADGFADHAVPVELPARLSFAKLGLAGCEALSDWPDRWRAAMGALPQTIGRVAVIYADRAAAAPPVDEVFEVAKQLTCRAALVDTFDKREGNLLDHWSVRQIERFIGRARNLGMLSVVAGSLTLACLDRVLALQPDVIAVRGAACAGGRSGRVDGSKVAELVDRLKAELAASALRGGPTTGY
jgi:uncharacterized protein (UPF0264 family)